MAADKQIPADYGIVLMRMAREQGVALGAEFEEPPAPGGYMPLSRYRLLLERYTESQAEPDWGFRLGQQMSMASHGALGFGAVSAPTIRDGLIFLCRYLPIRASYVRATVAQRGNSLHLLMRHDASMEPFRQRSCETLSLIIQSYIESAGGATTPLVWRFPYSPPQNEASYGFWLQGSFTFDADLFRLEVPGSVGMIASAFRNDAAYQATLAQSEELLSSLSEETTAEKVRAILAARFAQRVKEAVPVTDVPSADEVASQLGFSRRTLIRHLKQAGTSFQNLKEDLIMQHLKSLLANSELPLAEVAHRLGYADGANFTRACKRIFGATPRALRNPPDRPGAGLVPPQGER